MGRGVGFVSLVSLALVGPLIGTFVVVVQRYQGDIASAYARLTAVDRVEISSDEFGVIEYADRAGEGPPLLVSHGIFHGCDGGLLAVRDVIEDRRIIVPSRFGYMVCSLQFCKRSCAYLDIAQHVCPVSSVNTFIVWPSQSCVRHIAIYNSLCFFSILCSYLRCDVLHLQITRVLAFADAFCSTCSYHGSTLPQDASSAMQADAFVALLDHLDIDKVDVMGISAGTSAAIQLAIRHPDRVEHLVRSSSCSWHTLDCRVCVSPCLSQTSMRSIRTQWLCCLCM